MPKDETGYKRIRILGDLIAERRQPSTANRQPTFAKASDFAKAMSDRSAGMAVNFLGV